MEIDAFLGIGIVGVALSLVMEWLKAKFGTESSATKMLVVALSIALGGLYWTLQDTALWKSVLGVLASASTFYTFVLRK